MVSKKKKDKKLKANRPNAARWTKAESPIRNGMVIEGKAILESVKNATLLDKIHYLFKDRKTKDDALSKKESSLILYPKEIEKDPKTGQTVPTGKALVKTTNMFHVFRNWDENRTVVLFGDLIFNEKKQVNEWLFYRIPNLKQFKEIKKRLEAIGMGLKDIEQDSINKLTLSKATIAKFEEEQAERIRQRIRRKERRKE